jgi:hypothetical protein
MRRLAIIIIGALLLTLITAAPAVAAPRPEAVTIVSDVTVNEEGFNYGTFTTSGSDLVCREGTFEDTRAIYGGFGGPTAKGNVLVDKTYTCADGTFFLRLQVKLDFVAETETISWVVLGGTGAYAHLQGSGKGTAEWSDPPGLGAIDTYEGFLIG